MRYPYSFLKLVFQFFFVDIDNMTVILIFHQLNNLDEILEEKIKSIFVNISKASCRKNVISFMSHILKAFFHITHIYIRSKRELDLDGSKFGFWNSFEIQVSPLSFNVLLKKWYDYRRYVFVCFTDYEKELDRVQQSRLIELLNEIGANEKDVRIIKNLRRRQNTEIRIGNSKTPGVIIQRGVRQGCILSPLLYNLFDKSLKEATGELSVGINANGDRINTLKYANHIVIPA